MLVHVSNRLQCVISHEGEITDTFREEGFQVSVHFAQIFTLVPGDLEPSFLAQGITILLVIIVLEPGVLSTDRNDTNFVQL